MAMVDDDLELLESFADRALPAAEMAALRTRLAVEPELASALEGILVEQQWRTQLFASLEPTIDETNRFANRVLASLPRRSRIFRPLRVAIGIAACIAISFFAGWQLGGKGKTVANAPPDHNAVRVAVGPKVEAIVSYQVALTDGAGKVTAVQNFDSLEKAREFSQDLGQWQERQRQMQEGAAIVVADRF